jgi:hypothetical protein
MWKWKLRTKQKDEKNFFQMCAFIKTCQWKEHKKNKEQIGKQNKDNKTIIKVSRISDFREHIQNECKECSFQNQGWKALKV